MKEGDYCGIIKKLCNPRDCPVEFCRWRDTVWAIKNLKDIAYNLPTSLKGGGKSDKTGEEKEKK